MITAEHKLKRQKNGKTHTYVYYHCTKRKDASCRQKAIEEKKLEDQVESVLSRFEIPSSFRAWAVEVLREQNKDEAVTREKIIVGHRREYDQITKKIDGLIDLRAAGEITAEEFAHRKGILLKEKGHANELLNDADGRVNSWLDEVEQRLSFAERARSEFKNGSIVKKKEILYALGSNLLLTDKIFSVSLPEALKRLETAAPEARKINAMFEAIDNEENKGDLAKQYSQNPILLRMLVDIRT